MIQVHCFLPNFLSAQPSNHKWLQRLLANSKAKILAHDYQRELINCFTFNETSKISFAALTAAADNLPYQEGYWLRCDPVELQADLAAVFLWGNEHLELTERELVIYQHSLRSLLEDTDKKFYAPHEHRWYLQLKQQPQINTIPLYQLLGKEITHALPYGAHQQYWRRLMVECEMHLQLEQANCKRLTQGQAQVNGIWLWGEGILPPKPKNMKVQYIVSDDPLAIGLASYLDIPIDSFAKDSEFLANLSCPGDYILYASGRNPIGQNWFELLYEAFRKRAIYRLILYLGEKKVYTIKLPRWRMIFKSIY